MLFFICYELLLQDEWSPLHIAAYIGHVQLVDMLISLDVNVNAVEKVKNDSSISCLAILKMI